MFSVHLAGIVRLALRILQTRFAATHENLMAQTYGNVLQVTNC